MPIYGDDKFKSMARSILPSSARKGARDSLNIIRRGARSRMNQKVRAIRTLDDALDCEDDLCAYEQKGDWGGGAYESNIKEVVWDRRNHDKIMPAQRWAEGRVRKDGIPREDRVKWLDAHFPQTLAGQHAVYGHIARSTAFEQDEAHGRPRYQGPIFETDEERAQHWAAERKANGKRWPWERPWVGFEELRDALLERELEWGKLNRLIKAHHSWLPGTEDRPRCLLGRHDLDDFVREVLTTKRVYDRDLRRENFVQVVLAFCELPETR